MEVKSANSTLQLNRAATAVDNSSSGGNSRQQFMELGNSNSGKQDEKTHMLTGMLPPPVPRALKPQIC